MTDRPSTSAVFHRAAELVGDDFTPPTAAAFADRRKRRRTSGLAVAAGVAVVAVVATVTSIVSGGSNGGHTLPAVGPSSSDSPWLTYADPTYNFSVEYPANWRTARPAPPTPAGFDEQVAILGTVLVGTQCHPLAGGATECGPVAARRLDAGDVAVTWETSSGPNQAARDANNPVRSKGTPTQIDGLQAWVLTTSSGKFPGVCTQTLGSTSGATREVDVSIQVESGQSMDMSACMGGSTQQLDGLQAEVLRSAESVHLGS